MARIALDFCITHIPGCADPFECGHPWYALLQVTSPRRNDPLREVLEEVLAEAYEAGVVLDAVVAQNAMQAAELWQMRESVPEAQKHEGGSIKNDVSVPVSRVAEFIDRATRAVDQALPGIRVVAFGHIGDGNIHFNLSQPVGMDRQAYLDEWDRIERLVSDIAIDLDGSFSAEHGIGELKRTSLLRYKADIELDVMRRLKRALDPKNIMNPGKIILPQ
jgi:D-lactate dehydrogenase (cytochrome)